MKSQFFTTQIEEIVYNSDDSGDAQASVSLNPTFAWVKFILTDDKPNGNKTRVPKEEFVNLVRTGIHAPIKMGIGEIEEDHSNAFPMGVITNLKETENRVEGLAALWKREREEDIASLKDMYDKGTLPQLSWEILYGDSKINPETGVEDLIDTSLRAVTVVGLPAYAGRTPIYAFASKDKNSSVEEQNVEELEQLKLKVAELEKQLADKETDLVTKASELEALNVEIQDLRTFKGDIEKEQEAAKKLEEIKNKFKEAGIEKDETYFNEKKENLLGLSTEALDFMIQEMIAFKPAEETASTKKPKIPNVTGGDGATSTDPVELAKELRQRLTKK